MSHAVDQQGDDDLTWLHPVFMVLLELILKTPSGNYNQDIILFVEKFSLYALEKIYGDSSLNKLVRIYKNKIDDNYLLFFLVNYVTSMKQLDVSVEVDKCMEVLKGDVINKGYLIKNIFKQFCSHHLDSGNMKKLKQLFIVSYEKFISSLDCPIIDKKII